VTAATPLLRGEVPAQPVPLDEVIRRFPNIRQSLLADFDDCALSALFRMRYENGWSTHPQARGTLFHRFAAECLRQMREHDYESIPVAVALSILEETLYQRNVPPEEIVRCPVRELPDLYMAAVKFARDNSFTIRRVIDIERRIEAPLTYEGDDGRPVTRVLSGALDALIGSGPEEATVLDWKTTWALPPKRDEDAQDPGVSYHGYFQQRFYAWLVMSAYPTVMAVTLREFYVYRSQPRAARVTRQDLPRIEQELRFLVSQFDRAVASGLPPKMTLDALERHGSWKPSPGAHCHWCVKAKRCPIDDDYTNGGLNTPEDAEKLAAVRTQAVAIKERCDKVLKPYVDLHGPVPVKRAKGRLVIGFRKIKGGLRWETFTPETGDRPTTEVTFTPEQARREAHGMEAFGRDPEEGLPKVDLKAALEASAARAREHRS